MTITTPDAVYRLTAHGDLYRENRWLALLRADLTSKELYAWIDAYEHEAAACAARFDAVAWE